MSCSILDGRSKINENRFTVRVSVDGLNKQGIRWIQTVKWISTLKHGSCWVQTCAHNTHIQYMFCMIQNYSHLGTFRILHKHITHFSLKFQTASCFLTNVVWCNNMSLFIWSALVASAFVWKTLSVWRSVGLCSTHKSSIFVSGQNEQPTWSYGRLYHYIVITQIRRDYADKRTNENLFLII